MTYHDYIRMCERTPTTIFAGEPVWPRAKMEVPFCPEIRGTLAAAARRNSPRRVIDQGVNICVQGPHNETLAEIEAYRRWGADVVCTTIYPEVVYFRELETCFAGFVLDIRYGRRQRSEGLGQSHPRGAYAHC